METTAIHILATRPELIAEVVEHNKFGLSPSGLLLLLSRKPSESNPSQLTLTCLINITRVKTMENSDGKFSGGMKVWSLRPFNFFHY